MIYSLLPIFLWNFLFGFVVLKNGFNFNLKDYTFCCLPYLIMLLLPIKLSDVTYLLIACFPLFMSVLGVIFLNIKEHLLNQKARKQVVLFYEMIEIYLKMGRSFRESVLKSAVILKHKDIKKIKFEKNVVVQQPKSRISSVFSDLEENLNHLNELKVGLRQSIGFLKQKKIFENKLKEKLKLALSQYRVQSGVIICLWFLAFGFVLIQGNLVKFKNLVLISFFMEILGLMFARYIITKFRISI